MAEQGPIWERPDSLRERARWYRAFAETHADATWALWLAAHLERQADELDAAQAAGARRTPKPGEPR